MAKSASPIDLSSLGTIGGPKAKGSKGKTVEVEIEGMGDYVAFAYVGREMESETKGSVGEKVRGQIIDRVIEEGTLIGRTPPNFSGVENGNKGSCQLRRKDDRLALKPEQVALMAEHGITVKHLVVVPGTFAVNPDYADDEEQVVKMIGLLRKNGFPDDYIVRQHEIARDVVAEESLDDIFAAAKKAGPDSNSFGPDVVRQLLAICATAMVGRSDWSGDLPDALAVVNKILNPGPEVIKAAVREQFTAADADDKKRA